MPHGTAEESRFDVVLVGGGLQSALMVLALRHHAPETSILLLERERQLGGNHTWCYHETDIDEDAATWIQPLVERRWPDHEVRFPGLERRFDSAYCAIRSNTVDREIRSALDAAPHRLALGKEALEVGSDRVLLADGETVFGRLVVDARGGGDTITDCGFQKFLGQEIRTVRPHGVERPVLMDAVTDQEDGFRFFYLLPFDERTLLVEDTRFATGPDLDAADCRARIARYLRSRGWSVQSLEREEQGVLPMPWAAPAPARAVSPLAAGYRGGWFHPATGYSLPVAARLADEVAKLGPDGVRRGGLAALAREHHAQRRYCHVLNRLLFRWYPPTERWHVFERFYRLDDELRERFYALRLRPRDRARLLVGKPPQGFSLRYRVDAGAGT